MRTFWPALLLLASCASKKETKISSCSEATKTVTLSKKHAEMLNKSAGPFMSDARFSQEHDEQGISSVWRLKNMPTDSIYHFFGLENDDAILKTNLGVQTNSLFLVGDLQGIPRGTTNCLYVKSKDNVKSVIKIVLEK